jgi:ribosomal protein L13
MKLAGGGSFTVPNGFPNDSFPLMVETGEKVHVTPASQVNSSSNFNDTNMVTALNKIHSRIVSLEQTTRVVSKRPISLNKKIVTREISSQQNANTRNNVKVS